MNNRQQKHHPKGEQRKSGTVISIDRIGQTNKGEVKVEFTGKNITPFGGIGLFSKFMRKLAIKGSLDKISGIGACNIGKKVVSIVHGFACGLERPSDTEVLQKDKVFQTVTGEDYPDQTTFSRFLKSCTDKANNIRQKVLDDIRATIAKGASVTARYGNTNTNAVNNVSLRDHPPKAEAKQSRRDNRNGRRDCFVASLLAMTSLRLYLMRPH